MATYKRKRLHIFGLMLFWVTFAFKGLYPTWRKADTNDALLTRSPISGRRKHYSHPKGRPGGSSGVLRAHTISYFRPQRN